MPFVVIFRSVRVKLKVTVSLDHTVLAHLRGFELVAFNLNFLHGHCPRHPRHISSMGKHLKQYSAFCVLNCVNDLSPNHHQQLNFLLCCKCFNTLDLISFECKVLPLHTLLQQYFQSGADKNLTYHLAS